MAEEMMYGVSSAEELVSVPIQGGKHENVKITEIVKEEVGEKNIPTITFKFTFPDNKTFTHREFPINRESIVKNISKFRGATVEEVVERESKKLAASIIHIMSSFVTQDKLIFKATGWEDYIDKMIEIAGTAYEGHTFRCKIVYNKKGFPTFPRTMASPWFLNMKDPDTIVVNSRDNVTPPTPTPEKDIEMPPEKVAQDEDLAF